MTRMHTIDPDCAIQSPIYPANTNDGTLYSSIDPQAMFGVEDEQDFAKLVSFAGGVLGMHDTNVALQLPFKVSAVMADLSDLIGGAYSDSSDPEDWRKKFQAIREDLVKAIQIIDGVRGEENHAA